MFFKCRACLAKDNHLSDLQAEIQNLRALVYPTNSSKIASPLDQELHQILDGRSDELPLPGLSNEEIQLHQILTGST